MLDGRPLETTMIRSVIAALAAALLSSLALAPPSTGSASSVAQVPDDGYPRGTTLYPGRLDPGPPTRLLHTEEEVIVDGDLRVPVTDLRNMWILGKVGDDYLVNASGPNFARSRVVLVRPDGSRRVLQTFGQRTTAVPSSDGRHLALVTFERPNTRIRVVRTRTGALVRERVFPSYGLEVSDYGLRRMVLTGLRSRTYWWNPHAGRLRLIVPRPAAAHIAADRLVITVPHPRIDYEVCIETARLSRPSVRLWRSCRNWPFAFSPDGRRMATVNIQSDGIGPSLVQVRRQDGKLLKTYRPPSFFGFVEWESDRRLLLQPIGRTYAAAVRCGPVQCRRISKLYAGHGGQLDPPFDMRWSFP
jgi:hypothetical protein